MTNQKFVTFRGQFKMTFLLRYAQSFLTTDCNGRIQHPQPQNSIANVEIGCDLNMVDMCSEETMFSGIEVVWWQSAESSCFNAFSCVLTRFNVQWYCCFGSSQQYFRPCIDIMVDITKPTADRSRRRATIWSR